MTNPGTDKSVTYNQMKKRSDASDLIRDGTPKKSPCGKKCFVATVVALFLFLIFVALPGGILIIVHGRKVHSLGCLIGGAILASTPAVAIVGVCIGFFIRRRRRKSTGSVALNTQRI